MTLSHACTRSGHASFRYFTVGFHSEGFGPCPDHALTRRSRVIETDVCSDFSSIVKEGVPATRRVPRAFALREPTRFPVSQCDVPTRQGLDQYRLISCRT